MPATVRKSVRIALLLALVATAAWARPAGHYPRPVYFDPRQIGDELAPSIVARFDALVVTETVDTTWVESVRAINPEIKPLLFFSGSTVRDTIGWDPTDSTTVQRLRKILAVENDWLLKTVDGDPVVTWAGSGFQSWAINLTEHCPTDDSGERASVGLARAMARRFQTPGTGIASYRGWSGMMLDQMFNGIHWVENAYPIGEIDADQDGVPDPSTELNVAWREEMNRYLAQLRIELDPEFIIATNGDTNTLLHADGQAFEDCLSPGRSWFVDMYGYGPGGHGGYLRGLALSQPGPGQFCVFYARYYDGITELEEDQFARLAAGSSCLGDGYYILERFDGNTFAPILDAPTYSLDIGTPAGALTRVFADPDTLYERAYTKAYVQVNPYHYPIDGVPARDAVFTFYASPDSGVITPTSDAVLTRWKVPSINGNPALLAGFDVRVDEVDESGPVWSSGVSRVVEWDGVSSHIEALFEDLAPDTWHEVSARALYRNQVSEPTAVLRFKTAVDATGYTPPAGAGETGDDRWHSSSELPDGPVNALTEADGLVIVGGDFDAVGSMSAGGVALFDGENWFALGDGVDGVVHAATVFGTSIVVGGDFVHDGEETNVLHWNGAEWTPLGEPLGATVTGLTVAGGSLYAGGVFDSQLVGYRLARWTGDSWEFLGAGGQTRDPSLKTPLLTWNGKVIAQGRFNLESGMVPVVVEWSGVNWTALGGEVVGDVYAMAVLENELYVGGDFSAIDGVAANHVAKWTGSRWINLGDGMPGPVHGLAAVDGHIVAGGVFDAGDRRHLMRWDGAFWTSVGTGTDGAVFAVAEFGDDLLVGGEFATTGTMSAPNFSAWRANDDSETPTDPGDDAPPAATPLPFHVANVRPNPAASIATLAFSLPTAERVTVHLFDAAGRRLANLLDDRLPAGTHVVAWDGRLAEAIAAPGVYFLQLTAGSERETRKVVWTR